MRADEIQEPEVTTAAHINPCMPAPGAFVRAIRAQNYLPLFADVWINRLPECLPTVITRYFGRYQRKGRLPRGLVSHPFYYHLSVAGSVL